ncbi:uncharacterized protein LOC118647197 [Monomorium pharaonis]|uniref:uncharacterized protein LOC118647197 n=1 Tax=Monomorium pharaonis TaxID=307658 RepID=UPI0017467335|nr:uncharacterized protein LOC118647197 [Monomorium pharaonis]
MDIKLKRLAVTKGYIDRFWENLLKVGKDKATQAYLKARLALLEDYWRRYEEGHYDLVGSKDAEVEAYFNSDAYSTTEDNYVLFKSRVNALIKDDSPASGRDASVVSFAKQIQLPKLDLPSFSGDPLAWESYRDLFLSLVGDVPDLAPVQKLQYLKTTLSGEAAEAVANMEMTSAGFDLAWSELKSRYDNRRVLLASHMRAFLGSPAVTRPSPAELKRLSSSVMRVRRSFESLGRPVAHWDDWFVHVIVEKMDPSSRLFWEASLKTTTDFPTLTQLREFLQTRIRSLEAANVKASPQPAASGKPEKKKVSALATSTTGKSANRCSLCQGNHLFNYCPRFKALSVPQRRDHAKKQGACSNCLKLKHAVSDCPSDLRCLRCGDKHHTLLHIPDASSAGNADSAAKEKDAGSGAVASSSSAVTASVAVLTSQSGGQVLLSTAQLICSDTEGREITIRALLDSGSEASFVTDRVAQQLCLPRRRVRIPVSGIQGQTSSVATQSVALTIGSRDRSARLHLPSALVLPRLTSLLPARRVQRHPWPHLAGLTLADPDYDQPAPVDAILGADVYSALLREGLRLGPSGAPSAQATALGWVLMGQASTSSEVRDRSGVSSFHLSASWAEVDHALQRFWQLEELPREPAASPENLHCESHFAATHARNSRGRYLVRLPRRNDPDVCLGYNRGEALGMLTSLERRLTRNPTLREQYVSFMAEYQLLGHMAVIPAPEIHRPGVYYLPHHAVFKGSDMSSKIRVVFNASSRTISGYSLNDLLLSGPKLQSELWAILSRWPLFRFVFTTDIVKMFRQILVHPEDTDLQRILWRADPSREVQDFRLLTVVYGTASAPYLALRTLLQLAEDEGSIFPLGTP